MWAEVHVTGFSIQFNNLSLSKLTFAIAHTNAKPFSIMPNAIGPSLWLSFRKFDSEETTTKQIGRL